MSNNVTNANKQTNKQNSIATILYPTIAYSSNILNHNIQIQNKTTHDKINSNNTVNKHTHTHKQRVQR